MVTTSERRSCVGCGALLSRYNPAEHCSACQRANAAAQAEPVKAMVAHVVGEGPPGSDAVGGLLLEWRRTRGKTQVELSKLLGWTQQYISQLERGGLLQSIDQRWHIVNTLEVSPHELGLSTEDQHDPDGDRPPAASSRPHRSAIGSVRAGPGQIHADGFVPINTWSAGRSLSRENLDLAYVGEHPGNLSSTHRAWNDARARFVAAGRSGSVASVVGFRTFDYRDAPGQEQFGLDLARIDYATQLATRHLLAENRMVREGLQSVLMHEGLTAFVEEVPPSAIAANINVVSADGRALMVQRSAMVATYPSQWNLGINETMNYYDHNEDFFDLVERGLIEETGLLPDDVTRLVVSWFGYCFDCANFYLFAHVATPLNADEVLDRVAASRDSYEHSEMAWKPLEADSLQSVVDGAQAPDGSTRWLHHARLSAIELWRVRNSL